MKGYKAFHKDMSCQGFKYKEGETYKTDKAVCCSEGFHFCKNPLDVLSYYDLCESRFHEVESLGGLDKGEDDSKYATTEIKIGAKLSVSAFVEASVSFLMKKCKSKKSDKDNSKDYAQLASSGDSAKLASSGYSAKLASSGDFAQLALNGKDSVGAGIGINNTIKGKKGDWIILAEWKYDNKINRHVPVCVKSAKITGRKLKEDTYYKLENGKFVEAK